MDAQRAPNALRDEMFKPSKNIQKALKAGINSANTSSSPTQPFYTG